MTERGIDYLTGRSKRRLDVVGGFTLLAATLPVSGLLSVGSALDTQDNPLYTQERTGYNGESFTVYKIRTLKRDKVDQAPNERGTNHSQASKFGNFIRGLGLDELPQLANVVKGDMSLVGPRPLYGTDIDHVRDVDPKLFDDWFDMYQATRPGLTGPGQVYRKLHDSQAWETWGPAMQLDLEYAEKATLQDDLKIIGLTPVQLIGARFTSSLPQ